MQSRKQHIEILNGFTPSEYRTVAGACIAVHL